MKRKRKEEKKGGDRTGHEPRPLKFQISNFKFEMIRKEPDTAPGLLEFQISNFKFEMIRKDRTQPPGSPGPS